MTLQEAKQELIKIKNKNIMQLIYCPITHKTCREDCVCYSKEHIAQIAFCATPHMENHDSRINNSYYVVNAKCKHRHIKAFIHKKETDYEQYKITNS